MTATSLPRRAALLLALLAAASPPRAAHADQGPVVALRGHAVVEDGVLRLGDLFDGLAAQPSRAAAPIGSAPAPGRRLVLEAGQLAAIARAQGLAWRPLTPHERAVVERPGRPVPRAEVEAALRAELVPLGLDPQAAIELPGFVAPMVPPGAGLILAAESAMLDPATGRFGATLAIAAEGMPTQRLRLAGRAVATAPVVLAARRLAAGEVVGTGDLREARVRADLLRPGQADSPDQVIGRQLRRGVAGEQPFLLADLAPPALVERNALVTLLVEAPGLQLSAQGRALEAAPRGALVPVMNLASRAVVEGVVVGPGRVRVTPGALPAIPR